MTKPSTQVCKQLLAKFPDTATKTLARIAYREHPALFTDVESARGSIRKLRGASGVEQRCRARDKTNFRKPKRSGDPFKKLPKGKTYFDEWGAVQVDGPLRCLILPDIHIPFHDDRALKLALKHGKENNANLILLNGDCADCFAVSRWESDPRRRDFAGEVQMVRDFLTTLRDLFPKARIIFKEGNHEERLERYLQLKAPELLGVECLSLASLFGFGELGIEHVGEMRPIRLGDLNVLHGHEYRFAIQNPVNPGRGLFLRAKAHAMCSHFHQSSYHSEKNVEEYTTGCWSTGCLCDLHPGYMPLNKWNHGFAFVTVFANNKFEVQNKFIANGKVY